MYISFFLFFDRLFWCYTWDEIKVIIMCITILAYICFSVHWFNQSNDVFSIPLLLGAAAFRGEDSDNDIKWPLARRVVQEPASGPVSRWVYHSLYIHHYSGRQLTRTWRTRCSGDHPDNFSLSCNNLRKCLESQMVYPPVYGHLPTAVLVF
jgi:hypothetical protein